MSLRFFWHKTLSMFCLQKWTIFGHLPARLKHLSWKTLWRPSARFRWVNINLNCPLFLVGGRFKNRTPGNSRGEELAWSSLGRRKEKANWGGEDPISRIKRNGEQDVPERRQSLHHGALVQRDQHRHSDHWSCLGTRLRLPAAFSVCLQVAEIREKRTGKARTTKMPPTSLNCLQVLQSLQLLLPCNCSVWGPRGHQRQHRHWPKRWGWSGETSTERWLRAHSKTDVRYDIYDKIETIKNM